VEGIKQQLLLNVLLFLTIIRLSVGHSGKHRHEVLEFEYGNGPLRYANKFNYQNNSWIQKESTSPLTPEA
jgi:Mago nashi protein